MIVYYIANPGVETQIVTLPDIKGLHYSTGEDYAWAKACNKVYM